MFLFRCANDIISGIVLKVLNGRPKTKQWGIDICLMYVELEKQDVVMVSDGKKCEVNCATYSLAALRVYVQ